jgi:hypothetical protein
MVNVVDIGLCNINDLVQDGETYLDLVARVENVIAHAYKKGYTDAHFRKLPQGTFLVAKRPLSIDEVEDIAEIVQGASGCSYTVSDSR